MSDNVVIAISPAEVAERAAWMLKGELLEDGKISVPQANANTLTVSTVASILNAHWQEVEDEHAEPERASDVDAYLTEMLGRTAILMDRQVQLSRRLQDSSHHSVIEDLGEHSPAQQRFERAIENDRKCLQAEDFAGIDASNLTLKGVHFDHCDLRNANFENARLSNCTFAEANLVGANFKNAQMPGTVLSSAVLRETNFDGANLCSAQLDWTNLRKALLCNANLQNALLESANLSQADCSGTDFTEANLPGAKLQNAICIASRFTRANLTNADLSHANLEVSQFAGARLGFANLICSEGFDRKKHKGVLYERTRLTSCKTVSTKKSILKDLFKWGNPPDVLCALGVLSVISMIYTVFTIPAEPFKPIQDQPETKVLKKHTPPKVKLLQ